MVKSKSIDDSEIAKFSAMADEWWDESGKFKPLHKLNPTRVGYVRDKVCEYFEITGKSEVFKGLDILDIGCGGGLLCEPMQRLGANVTGIDASEKNIKIASLHAEKLGLAIDYQCTSVEQLAEKDKKYDVVLNMEVIEHVADVRGFLEASANCLKPGGLMFIATLNRTAKSFTFAILGAEYILRWLPVGTHSWEKFLKPSEIEPHLTASGLKIKELQGVSYNPISDKWNLSEDLAVNYMMVFKRPKKKN